MPELPEVETIVRRMRPEIVGETITGANLRWERTLATPKPGLFKNNIIGQKVEAVNRRAKYIVVQLNVDSLLIHLRMSGDILFRPIDTPAEKHDRLLLELSNKKTLAFNDMRKFGRVWLTPTPEDILGKLGPEPLDDTFTPNHLFEIITAHKRQIKPLLLDQHVVAGLGNIYTDEALHFAGLHPLTKSDLIKREQTERLWRGIRKVLNEGIERNGTSIDWIYRGGEYQNYLHVYGRTDEPCLQCGTPIQKITVGQRGTHFCPKCQKVEL